MEQNRRHAGVIVYEVLNAATATQYRLQTQMLLSARQDLVLDMRRLRTISAEGYLFLQQLVQATQAYDGRVFFQHVPSDLASSLQQQIPQAEIL